MSGPLDPKERLRLIADALLTAAKAELKANGYAVDALGVSLFVAPSGPVPTLEHAAAFGGEAVSVAEFAPEWPFALTAELIDLQDLLPDASEQVQ